MNNEKEEWKDVVGWEGIYKVSSLGRIKSCFRMIKISDQRGFRTTKERIMKLFFNKQTGYMGCILQKEGKSVTSSAHRIVAIAFIPNPLRLKEVNHINCNKTDNRVENLEWVSLKENRLHASVNGLTPRGESHGVSKITEKQALEIKYGHKGLTQAQVAEIYGLHRHTVSNIRRGTRWKFLP